jgi:hypothetical protein
MSMSGLRRSRYTDVDLEGDGDGDDDAEEWSVSSRGRTSSHVPPRPPAHLLGSQFDPRAQEQAEEPPPTPPKQGFCARLCARLCMRAPGSPRQLHDEPRLSQTPPGAELPDRYAARYGVGAAASPDYDDDSDDDIGVPIAADAEGFDKKPHRQVEMTRL